MMYIGGLTIEQLPVFLSQGLSLLTQGTYLLHLFLQLLHPFLCDMNKLFETHILC